MLVLVVVVAAAVIRDFSFSTTDGSATVKMTFGVICACVGFEDGRPSIDCASLARSENENLIQKKVYFCTKPNCIEIVIC